MDEDIKVQICRLCFSFISDKNFFSLKGSLKDMLRVIIADLDLNITDSPVMCHECSKSLQEMFTFKTNFFELEEKIDSKIANIKHKLNLSDIMNNDSKQKSTRAKLKNSKLCRTCLETIQGNTFISLNKNVDTRLSSTLDSCLPELDLNLTSDPVICQTCYKTLQKMRDFMLECKKNENQIKAYSKRMCSSVSKKVNLHSVLQFLFNSESKSEIPEDIEVKIEPAEDDREIKNEENIDPSEENELYDYPQYVMVKMKPIGTEQVKKELIEELSGVENSLDCEIVKMEYTDDEEGIGKEIGLENNANLRDSSFNTTKQNHGSQAMRSSKQLRQNKGSDNSEKNSMKHCSDCSYKTRYNVNLRRHQVLCHNRKMLDQCNKFKQNKGSNNNDESSMNHCPDCSYKTRYIGSLRRHQVTCHNRKVLDQCNKLKQSSNSDENVMNYCPDCPYKTRYKGSLKNHQFVRHNRKADELMLYHCNKCDFACRRKADLTGHNTVSHLKSEALQCAKCTFSTNLNSQYIQHVLMSHINAENKGLCLSEHQSYSDLISKYLYLSPKF